MNSQSNQGGKAKQRVPKRPGSSATFDTIPLIAPGDFAIAVGIGFFSVTSRLAPRRAWRTLSRTIARMARPVRRKAARAFATGVRTLTGGRTLPLEPEDLHMELLARHIERSLEAAALRGGRDGTATLAGRTHLEAALAAGKGAILWDSHFAFASIRTKKAFHDAGFGVHHLSRPDHGYSGTRFGQKWLNPFLTSVEAGFLAERVVMDLANPGIALRRLIRCLSENRIASFTVRGHAENPVIAPLFDGRIALGPGAPALAHRTGAALLPVFTVRLDDGSTETTIEAPIAVDRDAPRDVALANAGAEFARRLEPWALRHADQWLGWVD